MEQLGIPRIAWAATAGSAAASLPAARAKPLIHERAGPLAVVTVAMAGGLIHWLRSEAGNCRVSCYYHWPVALKSSIL